MFIFDEPTTKPYEDGLLTLIECSNHSIDKGNTAILIEHNLTMVTGVGGFTGIGPLVGRHGGQSLYTKELKGLLDINNSVIAKHLRRYTE